MKNLALTPGVITALNTLSRAMRHKILDAAMTYCLTGAMPEGFSTNAMTIFSLVIECSEIAQKQAEKEPEKEPEAKEDTPAATDSPKLGEVKDIIKKGFTDAKLMTREERNAERDALAEIKTTVCNRIGQLKSVG